MRSENPPSSPLFAKENSSFINFVDVGYEFFDFPALLTLWIAEMGLDPISEWVLTHF